MSSLAIIDYGMGNLGSVANACAYLGIDASIETSPDCLDRVEAVILPGQGAFGDCMANINASGFADPLREWIAADKPLLGVCVGLQVLFEGSEESPGTPGLGVLPGVLQRFESGDGRKVPQMGWNRCQRTEVSCPLWEGIPEGAHVYFVHSYYAPVLEKTTTAITHYGVPFTAAVRKKNLFATQFHPEKSQAHGKTLLRNFQRIIQTSIGNPPN